MINKTLEIISYADWISPVLALIQDFYYGDPYRIVVPRDCTIYATMLPGKGVRVWGAQIIGNYCEFRVRKPQKKYALYWLRRWGAVSHP